MAATIFISYARKDADLGAAPLDAALGALIRVAGAGARAVVVHAVPRAHAGRRVDARPREPEGVLGVGR